MENGSFQPSLPELNFHESSKGSAFPSQRTSSLQALIQQNEDLSVRLKFSIQKMAELEDQNDEVLTDNRKLQNTIQALNEQLLIWKEKERLWQERFHKTEFQLAQIKSSIPDVDDLNAELARYHRYHEKVKTQIKPYIQQLKDYAKGLSAHIADLNVEIERRDFDIQKLSQSNSQLETDLASHLTTHSQIIEDLKNFYNAEVANLTKENLHLRESVIVLEKKAEQLDKALERQDDLLNQNIILKRKTDDLEQNYNVETEGLRQSLNIARNEILMKTLQIENLNSTDLKAQNQLAANKEQIQQLQDQLAGLRILWTEQNSECEKLRLANESLERLNLELSQKLRDSREQK